MKTHLFLFFFCLMFSVACRQEADPRLVQAMTDRDAARVKQLLAEGARPAGHLPHSSKVLFAACTMGDPAIVKALLEGGADPNTDSSGMTSLMVSAMYGRLDIAKLLVEHRADVNREDGEGSTALFYSAMNGKYEMTKFLLENDAVAQKINKYNKTPLFWAVRHDVRITKLLVEHGVDVNVKDLEGHEAFFYVATREGSHPSISEVGCYLVQKGARVSNKGAGFNVKETLLKNNHNEILRCIQQFEESYSNRN